MNRDLDKNERIEDVLRDEENAKRYRRVEKEKK